MKPVTIGRGVSGIFVEKLEALVEHLRRETDDPRWHLHMQASQVPEYSVRVYSPDRHSELHNVTMADNTIDTIWEILAKEAELWQLRTAAVVVAPDASVSSGVQ